MQIACLGAGGFIGGWLTRQLMEQGHHVRAVDIREPRDWWQRPEGEQHLRLDLRDPDNARKAVAGCEWVYDLAEDMGGVDWLSNHRVDGLASFRIVLNVAEACEREGVERLWFASSACAYNTDLQLSPDVVALKESDVSPAKPEKGYGESKWAGERLCEYYQSEGRLETRVGRYHAIYGPHGTFTGERAKSPAALCKKVAEAVLLGHDDIEVWGDGEQTRSFCFVTDCIEGTLRLMASDFADPLNIGSSELVTINELVTIIEEVAGVDPLQRMYDASAPVGVRGRSSDNTLVREVLDWEPSTSLRDGIARLYPWIESMVRAEHSS